MDLPPLHSIQEYIPVPDLFQSFEKEAPFERCFVCDLELLDEGSVYLVEKAFRRGEVIFEYALCMACQHKLNAELSRVSIQRIEQYFEKRVDFVKRRHDLLAVYDEKVDPWIDRCLVSGKSRGELEEYQICTICDGPHLMFTYMPYMLSGEVIEDLQQRLSKTTRDRLDDFTGKFLGLPPEVRDHTLLLF